MNKITEIELKSLLKQYKETPEDLDLINLIAIGYFENPQMDDAKHDHDFFEKAFRLKETVKTMHNYAWFLYFEWSEIEWRYGQSDARSRALAIQKRCVELKPKTHYPYKQYGYMLLNNEQFEDSIRYLKIADSLSKDRSNDHNLGYCHYKLGQYKLAEECFTKAASNKDIELRGLFNLALTNYRLGNEDEFRLNIKNLQNPPEDSDSMFDFEIGQLYCLIEDYERAAEIAIAKGFSGMNVLDWKELSFAISHSNNAFFQQLVMDARKERTEWLSEIKANHEDWEDYVGIERDQLIKETESEIRELNQMEIGFEKIPKLDADKMLVEEYCGCLLFDCSLHGNIKDD